MVALRKQKHQEDLRRETEQRFAQEHPFKPQITEYEENGQTTREDRWRNLCEPRTEVLLQR